MELSSEEIKIQVKFKLINHSHYGPNTVVAYITHGNVPLELGMWSERAENNTWALLGNGGAAARNKWLKDVKNNKKYQ